jgi:hypothetical protein
MVERLNAMSEVDSKRFYAEKLIVDVGKLPVRNLKQFFIFRMFFNRPICRVYSGAHQPYQLP